VTAFAYFGSRRNSVSRRFCVQAKAASITSVGTAYRNKSLIPLAKYAIAASLSSVFFSAMRSPSCSGCGPLSATARVVSAPWHGGNRVAFQSEVFDAEDGRNPLARPTPDRVVGPAWLDRRHGLNSPVKQAALGGPCGRSARMRPLPNFCTRARSGQPGRHLAARAGGRRVIVCPSGILRAVQVVA